jgi:hypothetical protein
MSWTSGQASQNGNSTLVWTLGPFPSISSHDVIVLGLLSATFDSGVRIDNLVVRTGGRYSITVTVIGAGAVSFRFHGLQID